MSQQAIYGQVVSQNIGGIGFRIDDDQPFDLWLKYASLFDRYGFKASFAINMTALIHSDTSISVLRDLQARGFELMDHTPDHSTQYFTGVSDTAYYSGKPGVDHIAGDTVCLSYDSVSTKTFPSVGYLSVNRSMAVSLRPGDFDSIVSAGVVQFYLPILGKLCSVWKVQSADPAERDTVFLKSFWGEDINLGKHDSVAYYKIGPYDVHLSPQAQVLLAQRSLDLFKAAGLEKPYVWIQPGGNGPHLSSFDIRSNIAPICEYTAAATYQEAALKCFNEVDTSNDRQFAMEWQDFREDNSLFQSFKEQIADRVAKHYVSFGHSHFQGLLGEWNGYMSRMDSILSWCSNTGIPVKTYSQWAKELYYEETDSAVNVIPPLYVDRDSNGTPDGYLVAYDVRLDTLDGPPGECRRSLVTQTSGPICRITMLAGLEKGKNDFRIWTKGKSGSVVTVTFVFPEVSDEKIRFDFSASTDTWTEYGLRDAIGSNNSLLTIPSLASYVNIDVSCSNYVGGSSLQIGGMQLLKDSSTAAAGQHAAVPGNFTLFHNYPNPFNPRTVIRYAVSAQSRMNVAIFDILGRKVATLVDERKVPGVYDISWDASRFASGLYFCKMSAGAFTATEKMLLLK